MGILMFIGLIGTIAYGSHILKNDIQAEIIDKQNKPTLNKSTNKSNIRKNFKIICKRAGISLSDTGNPLDMRQCHKGMEYLQYRGYDTESVQYFKQLFTDKYNDKERGLRYKINKQHQQLMNIYHNSTRPHKLVTYKNDYYGDQEPEQRMNEIMKNVLWSTIVDNYTYIHSDNCAKYTEIWNLKVPANFFNHYNVNNLYKEVCWKEKIKDGGFMS